MRIFIPVIALAAATAAAFAAPPALGEECYADWGAAAEIVKGRNLMTVQEIAKSVPGLPGAIVKTTLCKDGDDYIYKLVLRDPAGVLKTVVLGAEKPGVGSGK